MCTVDHLVCLLRGGRSMTVNLWELTWLSWNIIRKPPGLLVSTWARTAASSLWMLLMKTWPSAVTSSTSRVPAGAACRSASPQCSSVIRFVTNLINCCSAEAGASATSGTSALEGMAAATGLHTYQRSSQAVSGGPHSPVRVLTSDQSGSQDMDPNLRVMPSPQQLGNGKHSTLPDLSRIPYTASIDRSQAIAHDEYFRCTLHDLSMKTPSVSLLRGVLQVPTTHAVQPAGCSICECSRPDIKSTQTRGTILRRPPIPGICMCMGPGCSPWAPLAPSCW